MNTLKNLTRGLLLHSSGLALMQAAGPHLARMATEKFRAGRKMPFTELVNEQLYGVSHPEMFDHDHNTRKQE